MTNVSRTLTGTPANTARDTSGTFLKLLRRGTDQTMDALANYTFEKVVFIDGTILENATLDDLASKAWNTISRNT